MNVRTPAQGRSEQLDRGERRSVGDVGGVPVPRERVEAADPEVAAGDEYRFPRGTPVAGWNPRRQQGGGSEPAGRQGVIQRSRQREGNRIPSRGTQHGMERQGPLAGKKGIPGRARIPERGEAVGSLDTHRELFELSHPNRPFKRQAAAGGCTPPAPPRWPEPASTPRCCRS
jgi:hypothetical protein